MVGLAVSGDVEIHYIITDKPRYKVDIYIKAGPSVNVPVIKHSMARDEP